MVDMTWVVNFANSIVGVGVLAMPFCFSQCGILLATVMVLVSAYLTKKTCEFMLRAGSYTRKTTFEQIALHVFGSVGKMLVEISTIAMGIGTLVAYQVVIGDLLPAIVHNTLGVQELWSLRTIMMIASSGLMIPLCLMRNVSSLASFNAISMGFYMFFIFIIVCLAIPNLYLLDWWHTINFWRPVAFFHCLPIISLAFTCQPQVFVVYAALTDPSMKSMMEIINKAINLCSAIYVTVGTFGYLAFYKNGIHGDILENFPRGFFTDGMKLGFWLSVCASFPLMVFPVRAAINSILFANERQGVLHDVIASAADYIAPDAFLYITLGLVSSTLVVGILIPHIEVVLSVTGALVGTFLCFVIPSALFVKAGATDRMKTFAQFVLVISVLNMSISTMTVLSGVNHTEPRPAHAAHVNERPNFIKDIQKVVNQKNDVVAVVDMEEDLLRALKTTQKHSEHLKISRDEPSTVLPKVATDIVKAVNIETPAKNEKLNDAVVKKDIQPSMLTLKSDVNDRNLVEKVQTRHQLSHGNNAIDANMSKVALRKQVTEATVVNKTNNNAIVENIHAVEKDIQLEKKTED